MNMENMLLDFMRLIGNKKVEIYNEFSLQHELGLFLRQRLVDYKIQFERNTNFFGINNTIKHEIDIVVYNDNEKFAIELKYPRNGQYPEQMFSFIKDIKFMEELKMKGFDKTYCLTLVDDKNFYSESKRKTDNIIYSYFRNKNIIHGGIRKPTGSKDEDLNIDGNYLIKWQKCEDKRFYIVRI